MLGLPAIDSDDIEGGSIDDIIEGEIEP
jgi:hypothetical protein